jgi:uncharacterized protein (DUF58 family)
VTMVDPTEEAVPGDHTVVGIGAATAEQARQFAEAEARLLHRVASMLQRRTGLTPSGMAVLGLAVVSWVLGRVFAGRPLYLVAYAAVAVLIGFRVGFNRSPGLVAERSQPVARVIEGTEVDVSLQLHAERTVSTVVIEEHIPALLGRSARIQLTHLAGGASASFDYGIKVWRRGVYDLGPLLVRWGDPFGLTQRQAVLCEPFPLFVHPTIEPLVDRPLTRMWEDPPIRPPISKPWPSGFEFYGMRPYQPGDDVRNIVWRAYARTRQLLVREAEQGISDKVVIVLDHDRRFHSRGVVSESFEEGVRAAASIAVHHLEAGYVVTLEDNRTRLCTALRMGPARTKVLDALAAVELGDGDLSGAITRLLADGQRDAHVLLVTPYLQSEAAARVELLIQRGVQVTVVALVWDEEHTLALRTAAALGAQVVQIRPGTPLAVAFRREVGTGHR